mmetsp:Transcript_26204/g.62272  ORF Transcript_26204/g.62272 Transcript_26204/m.62272 type:complete len:399 (+) Transcript_26204:255-1451(+)
MSAAASGGTGRSVVRTKFRELQRWLEFQQIMNRKRWFELDSEKNGPVTLFDFHERKSDRDDILAAISTVQHKNNNNSNTWKIMDDSVIGGYSTSSIRLIQQQDNDHMNDAREDENDENESDSYHSQENPNNENINANIETVNENESCLSSFVRWEGNIDRTVDEDMGTNKGIQRSGFANLRSPQLDAWGGGFDLGGRYNALEIVCRQPFPQFSSRLYTVNLLVESMIPDDMYQCVLQIPTATSSSPSRSTTSRSSITNPSDYYYDNTGQSDTEGDRSNYYPSTLDDIIQNEEGDEHYDDPEVSSSSTSSSSSSPNTDLPSTYDDGDNFQNVVVLFSHFMVTSGGKLRMNQRSLDNSIKIQSIGFTVGAYDKTDGPFALDIARIRAVNFDHTGVIGQAD